MDIDIAELAAYIDENWQPPTYKWLFPEVKSMKIEDERLIKTSVTDTVYSTGNGCCAGRALALAEGISMTDAEEYLSTFTGYTSKGGVYERELWPMLRDLGYTYTEARVRINSKSAKDKLPKRAILAFSAHVAFYEDGVIYDSYTTGSFAGSKQTTGYYTKDA